jgi:hypothetical protein
MHTEESAGNIGLSMQLFQDYSCKRQIIVNVEKASAYTYATETIAISKKDKGKVPVFS